MALDPTRVFESSADYIMDIRERYAKYFEKDAKNEVTIDSFYQLLMAEMSNQDPLEPTSNTEFVSQMATFASLQTQKDALYYSNANYAQSMVGKTAIAAISNGSGLDVETGVISRIDFSGGQFTATINGKKFPIKNIMEVLDNTYAHTMGSDGAFATSIIGKYVTVGMLTSTGTPVVADGFVEKIEIKDGEYMVVIDSIAYPLASVAKIQNEAPPVKPITPPADGEEEEIDEIEEIENEGTTAINEDESDDETTVIPEDDAEDDG